MTTITVIGLGKTGKSVINHLINNRPEVSLQIIDTRQNPPGVDDLPENIPLHTGDLNKQWMMNSDIIIVSPGIDTRSVEFDSAKKKGVNVIGDIEFFALELKRLKMNPKIIAITGSNGKSTVTTLCYDILLANDKHVSLGGNIGTPVFDVIMNNFDYYVLELSSFQLETLKSLSLQSAVHLNLSPDHLDRYDSMKHYNLAKHNIFNNCKVAIYNKDDKQTKPSKFSIKQKKVCFGVTNADYHLAEKNGVTYLMHKKTPLLCENDIKLVGQHNLLNILACFALTEPLKLNFEKTLDAIKKFPGLNHRCQLAHFANDVKWINDSKATNLGSLIACLNGLKASNKLHLLMGGDAKGADLSELKPYLAKFDVQIYCFGKDKEKIAELDNSALQFDTMVDAMTYIAPRTTIGDIVLLSPACASIDQFKNYEQRGDIFTDLAKKLTHE